MKRREFITLVGSAAATWPLAAHGQQTERPRRVGMLLGFSEADRQADVAAFREEMAKLGWVDQRNLRLDVRYTGGDSGGVEAYAAELVSLAPEVIVTAGGAAMRGIQQQTRTIPIVISGAGDPGVSGFVRDITHPEGNITGITNLYASIGGKWLELLKQAFPVIERIGAIDNPALNSNSGSVYLPAIEEAARALRIEVVTIAFHDTLDIVRGIDAFAAEPNGGLIVLPPDPSPGNRETVRRLAAEHRLPAIYSDPRLAAEGGLMAYGSNPITQLRRAASFVDRILRGAKVRDLPLEFPTRFELVINLKTAKALGLTIPESLTLIADRVIE
jgi:putative ABC transport system substrate-binding protein